MRELGGNARNVRRCAYSGATGVVGFEGARRLAVFGGAALLLAAGCEVVLGSDREHVVDGLRVEQAKADGVELLDCRCLKLPFAASWDLAKAVNEQLVKDLPASREFAGGHALDAPLDPPFLSAFFPSRCHQLVRRRLHGLCSVFVEDLFEHPRALLDRHPSRLEHVGLE